MQIKLRKEVLVSYCSGVIGEYFLTGLLFINFLRGWKLESYMHIKRNVKEVSLKLARLTGEG